MDLDLLAKINNMTIKEAKNIKLASSSINIKDFPPVATKEEEEEILRFYDYHPDLKASPQQIIGTGSTAYRINEPWIQTYTGRRFSPTNPITEAIVIEDIAHPLSMQCRFSGHVKQFYSVAQHSVLVSYICDKADALWGLLHDGSEAYLVDIPRPIKRSGKFDNYLEFEDIMQGAICNRFNLPKDMPASVKVADDLLLATEARDLMSPLHPEWTNMVEPLPFKIVPLPPAEAKALFLARFAELTGIIVVEDTSGYTIV